MNTPIEIKPEAEKLYEWLLDRTRLLNEPLSKTYVQQNAPNSMRRIEKLNPLLKYLEEKKKINCRPIGLKHYVFLTDDVPVSMQFPVVSNQRLNGEINNIEKLELIARISVLERQYKELNDRMLSFMTGFNAKASLDAHEAKTTQGLLKENETKDSSNEQKKIRKPSVYTELELTIKDMIVKYFFAIKQDYVSLSDFNKCYQRILAKTNCEPRHIDSTVEKMSNDFILEISDDWHVVFLNRGLENSILRQLVSVMSSNTGALQEGVLVIELCSRTSHCAIIVKAFINVWLKKGFITLLRKEINGIRIISCTDRKSVV